MTSIIDIPDRRGFLKLSAILSAMATSPSALFAQEAAEASSLKFLLEVSGQKFGVKIMAIGGGTSLVSCRQLNGKGRMVYAFKGAPNVTTATLKLGDKDYQVFEKNDWIATNAPGIRIGNPEYPEAPESNSQEQTKKKGGGFLKKLWTGVKRFVSGAVLALGVAFAWALTFVTGRPTEVRIPDGGGAKLPRGLIQFSKEGTVTVRMRHESHGWFKAPPPGVPEKPGTWY